MTALPSHGICAVLACPRQLPAARSAYCDAHLQRLRCLRRASERREYARQRQAIIDSNPELRERELIKLATLAAAIADALRKRGISDPAASLTAETGIAVFKIAFARWVSETGPADLPQIIRESLADLKAVTAGT